MSFPQNCRGKEAKSKIVKQYSLWCVGHLKLLPGQSKQGCCGVLTDQYYAFEYQNKKNPADSGVFYVGRSCAIDFQKLHKPTFSFPRLFDPFKHAATMSNIAPHGEVPGRGMPVTEIDPLNKEVQTAIFLILTIWNVAPTGGFSNTLNYIKDNPEKRTKLFAVYNVNRIVEQYMNGRTLRQALQDASNGAPMRTFNFPLMEQVLTEQGYPIYL